jgi:hypothetical protein
VIVHYSSKHSPDQEWVYNGADIDHSKVVWAREMDPKSDAQLIAYFKDREVWLLNADSYPQRVGLMRLPRVRAGLKKPLAQRAALLRSRLC